MDEQKQLFALRAVNAVIFFLLFCATFVLLWSIASSEPFIHDEAVYLTKARSWMDGSPADQWRPYRPIGMSIFGWALLHFGDSERVIRSFGIFFGALAPGVIFLLFRQMSNMWVALAAALTVATSTILLQNAPMFLNDVPASTLLFAALGLLYIHYKSAGTSNSIYLVAPLAALSFYLRYGAITSLIMIAIFSYLLLMPRFLRKEKVDLSRLGKLIALSLILFIPHIIYSVLATGDPFGVISSASSAVSSVTEYFGEGLIGYLLLLPEKLGGWPFGVCMILGLVTYLFVLLTPLRTRYPGIVWLGSISLSTFILTGLLAHDEVRYIFFPSVLLVGIGIAGTFTLIDYWSRLVAATLLGVLFTVLPFFAVLNYREVSAYFRGREQTPATVAFSDALEAIRKDNAIGSKCAIWTTRFQPQASWYSKCGIAPLITDVQMFNKTFARDPKVVNYSVVFTAYGPNQITPESAASFGVRVSELYHSPKLPNGEINLYRISENDISFSTSTATSTTP